MNNEEIAKDIQFYAIINFHKPDLYYNPESDKYVNLEIPCLFTSRQAANIVAREELDWLEDYDVIEINEVVFEFDGVASFSHETIVEWEEGV